MTLAVCANAITTMPIAVFLVADDLEVLTVNLRTGDKSKSYRLILMLCILSSICLTSIFPLNI